MHFAAKQALVLGVVGASGGLGLGYLGVTSQFASYLIAAAAALAGALRFAYVKMLSGSHFVGAMRRLAQTERKQHGRDLYAVTDVGANRWRMSDGAQIHHFEVGSGAEHVIVLHGGPGAAMEKAWPGITDDAELCGKFTFHFFHQRGCGLSSRDFDGASASLSFPSRMAALDKVYGLTRQIADVEAIRRHIVAKAGRGSKVHLLGHSFGGFIGALYLAELEDARAAIESFLCIGPADLMLVPHSRDLLSIIRGALKDDPPRSAAYDAYLKRMFAVTLTESEADMGALNLGSFPFYFEAVAKLKSPAVAARLRAVLPEPPGAPCGYGMTGAYFSLGMFHDYRADLAAAHGASPVKRVIVAHCTDDVQAADQTAQYAQLLKSPTSNKNDVELVEVDGVVHFPHFEDPRRFQRLLRRWLLE